MCVFAETLGHGEALDEVVRLVRLTRPEVILTWMPAYVAGENHGDHQASGWSQPKLLTWLEIQPSFRSR